MPSSEPSDPPSRDINLLTALQTAFSKNSDPETYLARAHDEIEKVEGVIIETCSKNRIRVDDNLYALLESRDGLAEQAQEVESATKSASEITLEVDNAVAALSEKMQVRKNLDAALSVAAQTRKLTRMYARIEDTIDSRRLYTAFRMLEVLEEETRCVKPGTFLQELVPDTGRLRSTIALQSRKSFYSWLAAVRKTEAELGSYALHHAHNQASGRQMLLSSSRLGSMNSLKQGVSSSRMSSDFSSDRNRSNRGKPWTPMLTPQAPTSTPMLQRGHPPRSYSSHRMNMMAPVKSGISPEPNFRPEIGSDGRAGLRSFTGEYSGSVPTLYLRPLLQSVLVNDGLELLREMRADYRRERLGYLKKMLEEVVYNGDDAGPAERDSPQQVGSARARQVETLVFRVCGFFVVERAVEQHAKPELLPRSVVDHEWWTIAFPRMQILLREQDDTAMLSAADKAWARSLQGSLDRFAQVNGFIS